MDFDMNAVVVFNVGNPSPNIRACLESVENYCTRYGLKMEVVTEAQWAIDWKGYPWLRMEKFQVHRLFDKYDRILRLDSDVLVTHLAPNVFDIVPEDRFGAVRENVGSRRRARNREMKRVRKALGPVDWRGRYFNSGVVVASRGHRKVFEFDPEEIRHVDLHSFKEQNLLNWRVADAGFEICELSYRWNHLDLFSQEWNGNAHRVDSFILHYAGRRKTKSKMKADSGMVERGWKRWKKRNGK